MKPITLNQTQMTRAAFHWALLGVFASALFLASSTFVNAAIEERKFNDPVLEQRYKSLISELRCLVCQNQNLADSDAGLAKDLRNKTEQMLKEGKSDEEILDFMRDRYGDYVLYRPPLNASTALLWFGPFILLLLVAIIAVKRLQSKPDTLANEAELKKSSAIGRSLIEDGQPIENAEQRDSEAN